MFSGTVTPEVDAAVRAYATRYGLANSVVLEDALRRQCGLGPDRGGWRTPEPARTNQNEALFTKIEAEGDPLRASLQRARSVAPDLAAAAQEVNDALERVEQALAALDLRVTAAVDLYPDRNKGDDRRDCLRFGKEGSTWRLWLESGPDGGDAADWSQSPLLSASNEVRLQAIERLPALVDGLVRVAEDQVGKAKIAARKADATADVIAEAK